ncbi:MAG: serine--tRNA ligase [Candidatus Blackburnbacteria bacterium]|nr:serine--tRNA ligase [Candidatus Blackburnbacteria bacterium]
MIDINLIRENPEKVKEGVRRKQYDPSVVDCVLELDKRRLGLLQQTEELRRERNEISKEKSEENIARGKEIKAKLQELEPQLKVLEGEYVEALAEVPNLPFEDVRVGKGEEENVEIRKWGEVPQFSFSPKDHVDLGRQLDIIDFEAGAKVAGSGFYYLKNEGALLEVALVQYGFQFLVKKGFTPIVTPDLAKERFYLGTGYQPHGEEAQTFTVIDSDLGLIATAEITLAGYHADEVLNKKDLPRKYAGYSHCFRQEAGAYGKYSKGLYRVHQFTKVEMFAFTTLYGSQKVHEEFLALEEEFWKSLEIPYRVIEMCTGDLGAQAARKYDLEAWMPGRKDYGEVTSTSNTTDYQARNLGVRYRDGDETEYVHTLNGTLVATSRAIIAILENYQQEDGSVVVPEALRQYIGKDKIILPSA